MEPDAYAPPGDPLAILHHDHELLLVDKPTGLLSVPGKGEHLADCLLRRVQAAFPEALLVHRSRPGHLGRDGVRAHAPTPSGIWGLQFERRQVRKTYVARLHGRLEPRRGTVDLPLRGWTGRTARDIGWTTRTAARAMTEWRVLRASDEETRVRLMPRTGRSHQLRVHMAELGHPILGDPFYADEAARDHPRLMLHAEALRLRHPDGGRGVEVKSKAPF